jgi:hypothetical protein
MATIAVTSELDVLDKYQALIKQSLDSESVYIRTKETLEDIFEKSSFTNKEKSEILSQVLVGLNSSLVNASMGTAMQWSSAEKDVALKKLELAKQLDIMDEEIKLKQEQYDKLYHETIATQAQTIRQFGKATVLDGTVTALDDTGKVAKEIEVMEQQRLNALQENTLIQAKQKESYAAVHKIVADTNTLYGNFTYAIDDTGVSSVTNNTPLEDRDKKLSYIEYLKSKEQAKGYVFNAWANATNGAASAFSTLISSDYYDDTDPAGESAQIRDVYLGGLKKLLNEVGLPANLTSNGIPVITLIGSYSYSVTQGTTYTDPGAIAYSPVDGNISSSIVVNNPVNTNVIGLYRVTYNVIDSQGYSAERVERLVSVVAP